MKVLKSVSIAAVIAVLSVAPLSAKSLRNADEPAEFPPASFKGSQYVDSRGCVYVRAGYAGGTQWVPRVTRSRDVMCGFKPTQITGAALPVIKDEVPAAPVAQKPTTVAQKAKPATVARQTAVAAAKPAAPSQSTPERVQVSPVATASRPTVSAAKPTVATAAKPVTVQVQAPKANTQTTMTRTTNVAVRNGPQEVHPSEYVMKRLPAGVTVRTADGGQMTTTEPTLVRVPVPAAQRVAVPQYVAVPQVTQVASNTCANLSGNAAQYMTTSSKVAVRCGPQAQHPSDFVVRRQAQAVQAQAQTVQIQRTAAAQGITVPRPVPLSIPAGYERVWEDGRLNPNRGPRTLAGDLQQAQVWTQETPARDVYAPKPKTIWESLFGTGQQKTTVVVQQAPVTVAVSPANTRVSTKSVAPAATPKAKTTSADLRYVQVGAFGVESNANASIARLSSMGVPVSSQMLNRGGKTIKVVLAGPFGSSQQTLSALGSIRAAGYSDAFARK